MLIRNKNDKEILNCEKNKFCYNKFGNFNNFNCYKLEFFARAA